MNFITFILIFPWLFFHSLCEITEELKAKLSSDFINYYNLQPSHDHSASDGYLQSIREIVSVEKKIKIFYFSVAFDMQLSGLSFCKAFGIMHLGTLAKLLLILNIRCLNFPAHFF